VCMVWSCDVEGHEVSGQGHDKNEIHHKLSK